MSVDTTTPKSTADVVLKEIGETIDDIKGAKLYYELVEELKLVDELGFNYLLNLQVALKEKLKDIEDTDKKWSLEHEIQDLRLLSITFLPYFYKDVMYFKQALYDIKKLQSILLEITKWLFSDDKDSAKMPNVDIKYSEQMLSMCPTIPKLVKSASNIDGIVSLKTELLIVLSEILVNASMGSVYHKPLSDEKIEELNKY